MNTIVQVLYIDAMKLDLFNVTSSKGRRLPTNLRAKEERSPVKGEVVHNVHVHVHICQF